MFRSSIRLNIGFVLGLLLAAGLATALDRSNAKIGRGHASKINAKIDQIKPISTRRILTESELIAAQVAWTYFENNTRKSSGLANSVNGFPSTTMWDTGSYIMAMVSANRLGIITDLELHHRGQKLLSTLSSLALFNKQLPNKAYHTISLAMVDYSNQPAEKGIGWSALDITRLYIGLRILVQQRPELLSELQTLIGIWDFHALVQKGELAGADLKGENGSFRVVQEGRIGYEQYGARSAALFGLDALNAISARDILDWKPVEGVMVPVDRRHQADFEAINVTLSEPYMLMGLEIGMDSESAQLSSQVYRAMHQRFIQTAIPTMVSEDHIDQAPHFLYSSVYGNEEPWAVLTDTGDAFPELRTISLKAAYAWHALYQTDYTYQLLQSLNTLAVPDLGWQAGRYETDNRPNTILTANTNAVVLEALHFIQFGPLLQ